MRNIRSKNRNFTIWTLLTAFQVPNRDIEEKKTEYAWFDQAAEQLLDPCETSSYRVECFIGVTAQYIPLTIPQSIDRCRESCPTSNRS